MASTFIGRKAELQDLHERFRPNRILGIFGERGVGKSCLAHQLIKTLEAKKQIIHCDFFRIRKFDGVLSLLSKEILGVIPELLYNRDDDDDDDDDFVDATTRQMDQIISKMEREPSTCFLLWFDNLEYAKLKPNKDGSKPDRFRQFLWDKVYTHIFGPFLKNCSHTRVIITSTEMAKSLDFANVYVIYELKKMSEEDSRSLFEFQARVQSDNIDLIREICELCDNQPGIIINAGKCTCIIYVSVIYFWGIFNAEYRRFPLENFSYIFPK